MREYKCRQSKRAPRMDCIFLCETYEQGVSVLWRACAALLRWQRLAIRKLALCTQRAAAVRALRAREESAIFPSFAHSTPAPGRPLHPPADVVRRVRQRCCEISGSLLP